jgi:predicted RNA methylase
MNSDATSTNAPASDVRATSSYSATYSPEDNKLRLYSVYRLDSDLYARVREAGFRWAPAQKLFVAPMWTPEREDLLLELCGEIGDEDTTLVDRAEQRAERFGIYQEHRAADAESARRGVEAITSGIPLGQPILIGHHSQRRAVRDAERIESGMRKAVRMWDTAQYWKSRAAGALAHAKYKDRPEVRHRRIADLESKWRVMQARYTPDPRTKPQVWDGEAHVWCGKGRGGHWVKESQLPLIQQRCARWEAHYKNRIEYERAMLAEDGGIAADSFDIQVGGRVLVRGEWVVATRVNRKGGKIFSVSTNARYVSVRSIEEISDYRAPTPEDIALTKKTTRPPPLVNYRTEGCLDLSTSEWKQCERFQSGGVERIRGNEAHAVHRQRVAYRGGRFLYVFLTDSKVIDPPKATGEAPVVLPRERAASAIRSATLTKTDAHESPFKAMREQLRTGVKAISAPQLFPTPKELAKRMIDTATHGLGCAGLRVLEPSAGTGVLLDAVIDSAAGADCCTTVAVEIDERLATELKRRRDLRLHTNDANHKVVCADFLLCNEELGTFDRILMNPPFADGADVDHVTHALTMLSPGGRLVAIMSSGVTFRQDKRTVAFRTLVQERAGVIEPLPDDTFAQSGTLVRTVLATIDG